MPSCLKHGSPTLSRRWSAAVLACACLSLLFGGSPRAQTGPSEYEVKATILYKAARFITWPDDAFEPGVDTISLCVLGPDPVARAISALDGQMLAGRRLVTRQLSEIVVAPRACHILFASRALGIEAGLARIRMLPVLTAGDFAGFAERGGMLGMKISENKVRFEVNLQALRTSGLDVSPQLLQLSTVVPGSAGHAARRP